MDNSCRDSPLPRSPSPPHRIGVTSQVFLRKMQVAQKFCTTDLRDSSTWLFDKQMQMERKICGSRYASCQITRFPWKFIIPMRTNDRFSFADLSLAELYLRSNKYFWRIYSRILPWSLTFAKKCTKRWYTEGKEYLCVSGIVFLFYDTLNLN